jgi:multiple sugar transport system ATP-binding protein
VPHGLPEPAVTEQLVVSFAGHELPLPADVIGAKPGIERYFGREVILGIRPSDFEDASLADPGWARMPVTAHVTEELGSEIARSRISAGRRVELGVDTSNLHFFDPENGLTIGSKDSATPTL